MARWALRGKHYLKVPGTEWEYKETDRSSGRQGRKVYQVPLYLNPDDPSDCNYPGEIIVCHAGKGTSKDIVFEGDPTPDMEPLDEEATKISDGLRPQWNQNPLDVLPGSYSQSLLEGFQRQIAEVSAKSSTSVSIDKFTELQEQVKMLTTQNAQLLEQMKKDAKRA